MILGVQYYRPPFPLPERWAEDFRRIRDSGLGAVQLWVLWSWVEARPGRFRYDDYDRLVELAGRNGLGVVLSTIAEIQPHWIHRLAPGSEMVTSQGHKVVSSQRGECHFGLTPGGCTDHPGVWKRMSRFLAQTVRRYRSAPNLVGWDAWNELRWNVQADGLVCHCRHTLAAFRRWLAERYGTLDGLNRAWLRRYGRWSEVLPGKTFGRPYTEMMAFQRFLTVRANRHARARYEVMKPLDPRRPVTVHAAEPCPGMGGGRDNTALDRGNDWFLADSLDGVGCSSFPKWAGLDDADFGMRVEFVHSAARGKRVWLSEIQGGRASSGFEISAPVDAPSQQRWIWNGLACGAEAVLFWCWRDEVFGREAGGFGIVGRDGLAAERLAALQATAAVLAGHRRLLEGYRPARPEVGVLFSPSSYYLHWAQEGNSHRPVCAVRAYARALVRRSVPYLVAEEEHLEALAGLKVLFLPRVTVTGPEVERRLAGFLRGGGTLVCESECGAFSPEGLYRDPEERWLAGLTGAEEVGRRPLAGPFRAAFAGRRLRLDGVQWLTPLRLRGGRALARHAEGALLAEAPVGRGRALLAGTYLGGAYINDRNPDFEAFLELAARRAGWRPEIEVLSPAPAEGSFLYVKSGLSGGERLVFAFFPAGCRRARLRFRKGFFGPGDVRDIVSGRRVRLAEGPGGAAECVLAAPKLGIAVLAGPRRPAGSARG